jgi:hypothetical protein
MARRIKKDREYWVEVISHYRSSGLKQKQFCSREELSMGVFQSWLYRLKAEERQKSAFANPLFAPIVVEPEPNSPDLKAAYESALILELSGKMRIVVQSGFGSETLRRLLDVVGHHV